MVIGLKKVLCGTFSLYIKKRFVVFKLKDVSMKHVFKDVLMAANITIGWVQRKCWFWSCSHCTVFLVIEFLKSVSHGLGVQKAAMQKATLDT